MAKHIFISLLRNPNAALRVDVEHFARNIAKLQTNPRPLVHWPTAWFDAALIAHGHDGLIEVTPRGADLLASIDSLPDAPTPEVKVTPCSKCNGTGEQPLFVSMETCSRCEGRKTEASEPRARLGYNRLYVHDEYVHDESWEPLSPFQAFGRTMRLDPRPDRRTPAQLGSAEVNSILCHFMMSGRKVPDRVGDLDPALVCKAWTDRGSPMLDGDYIVFNMAWLDEPEFDRVVRR